MQMKCCHDDGDDGEGGREEEKDRPRVSSSSQSVRHQTKSASCIILLL